MDGWIRTNTSVRSTQRLYILIVWIVYIKKKSIQLTCNILWKVYSPTFTYAQIQLADNSYIVSGQFSTVRCMIVHSLVSIQEARLYIDMFDIVSIASQQSSTLFQVSQLMRQQKHWRCLAVNTD